MLVMLYVAEHPPGVAFVRGRFSIRDKVRDVLFPYRACWECRVLWHMFGVKGLCFLCSRMLLYRRIPRCCVEYMRDIYGLQVN